MKIEAAEYTDKMTGEVTEYHYVSKETILAAGREVVDLMKERADLAKYGRHLPGCWANDWPVKACNCGWEEVAVRIGLLAGPTPTFTEADDAIA